LAKGTAQLAFTENNPAAELLVGEGKIILARRMHAAGCQVSRWTSSIGWVY
jgi:hypothetical protein